VSMLHLITGGSGFIGARLARALLARGDRVRVLDLVDDPDRPKEIEFCSGSTTDMDAVSRSMKGVDSVHHHAALVAQASAGRRYWDVNLGGTQNVAMAAVREGASHVIHLSTTAVYGLVPPGPITSQTPTRPIEAYGKSKLAGERAMQQACESAGIPLITIRPRVTLGSGRLGIFHTLFDWMREGRAIPILGSGNQRQQFIHVDDLLGFYSYAMANGLAGTFNVGTDSFGTLLEDLESLIDHTGMGSRILPLPVWPAQMALGLLHGVGLSPLTAWHYRSYPRDCYFDTKPLADLGWKPVHSNVSMLKQSYDWFLQHRDDATGPSAHRSPLRQGALALVRALC